nr:glycosyltransferase family 2 protein [Rubidibacter lacunae]
MLQIPATLVLLSRLLRGPGRLPPLMPKTATPEQLGATSVVVPTLNEAERIGPCLEGLSRQGCEVREIVVVDSRSTDGTPDLVRAMQHRDPRFRVIEDDPLPPGWVGRPWALHWGFHASSPKSQWFLGIDADTQPRPGLVASLLDVAETQGFDLISLAPQFVLEYPGEWWLQPALLVTLIFRSQPAGADALIPERVMANGQCFLCRRRILEELDGYSSAAASFCDDVTLARNIAARGYRVGFLDGARVFGVRMYLGAVETWREWGRSLDLKDAAQPGQVWGDLWLLSCVQALPLLASIILSLLWVTARVPSVTAALGINLGLLAMRFALLLAIAPSYTGSGPWRSLAFWLSPLADLPAVIRILLSALRRPKKWRGRAYG